MKVPTKLLDEVSSLQRLLRESATPTEGQHVTVRDAHLAKMRESYANSRNRVVRERGEAPIPAFLLEATSYDKMHSYVGWHPHDPGFRGRVINELFNEFWEWAEEQGEINRPAEFRIKTAPASSSNWTGRYSNSERAIAVLELAPIALEGVRALIEQESNRLSNGPPEPIEGELLSDLRALHAALGDLIDAVKHSGGTGLDWTKAVELLAHKVFSSGEHVRRLMFASAAPSAAAVLPTWGTVKLLELITGTSLDGGAIATVTTGYLALGAANEAGRNLRKG